MTLINGTRIAVIGWLLAAVMQAGSFAYFMGGLTQRVKNLENGQHDLQQQIEQMEQRLLWKADGGK